MVLDKKTKKVLKIFCLVLCLAVLTGCKANLDPKTGELIASRAITLDTPWTFKAGWFDFFLVIPISKAIIYIGDILVNNMILGVVLMTVVINIIILPIMIKSTVSTQKMQLIQPEMERIQNKYKGRKDQASQMKMSQELQNLYKKNGVSMMSSFTMFLTMPIMIAMWQAVQRIEVLYGTTVLGLALGDKPIDHIMQFEIPYIIILVLVGITQFFAIKINDMMNKRNPRYKQSKQMSSMNTMNNVMTIMIIYFSAIMPTAMSFYWMTSNIITIARTYFIHVHYIEKVQKEVDKANTSYLNKRQHRG